MSRSKKNLWAVVLAGGYGKRLWPLSRKALPKQFLDLYGNNTLIEQTIERVSKIKGLNKVLIVTNEDHSHLLVNVTKKFPKLNFTILLEPLGRNTGPAIFSALTLINKKDEDAFVIVTPSDQFVEEAAFKKLVIKTLDLLQDEIVNLGIKPRSAHTGYGYMRFIRSKNFLKKVLKFKEKPSKGTATKYINSKNYLWNSGILIFKIESLLNEFKKHQKDFLEIHLNFNKKGNIFSIEKEDFSKFPNISIDYSILEKSDNIYSVELDCYWSDLGSWQSLEEIYKTLEKDNVLFGEKTFSDKSVNNLVFANKTTVLMGVKNLVIVDTDDSLLISNSKKRLNQNKILKELKKENPELLDHHRKVYRPWGWYDSIEIGEGFQVKRLHVYPKEQLSVQKHMHRSERWVVIKGVATVLVGNKKEKYKKGEVVIIEKKQVHSLANTTKSPVEIIEVQLGSYLGEDDIIRYSDKYGRD